MLNPSLPEIPVVNIDGDLGPQTLEAERDRAEKLLDAATSQVPRTALTALDFVSRRWLSRWDHASLPEIDKVADMLGRPGAYFLSVNYEWGCTCRIGPSPDGDTARLARVLDWRTPGLGRFVIAARVAAPAGQYLAMTWPGYTGVLQGMAPGRFSAALNQAPMRQPIGLYAIDWAANKARVWSRPHPTPAHLLREVFESARNFTEAKARLTETAIASPCIFVLAGTSDDECVVIEREEERAQVHSGAGVAANHWRAVGWRGLARGHDSAGRSRALNGLTPRFDGDFAWLEPPVLNPLTRLAMVADAAEGRVVAQGFEKEAPATAPLDLVL
ncbi:MAG: hypothetical protein K0U74_14560 [Alphaproteobacteria bacterium]|nr:hypothetical protein [Alphaproteobacteria bacterium]